MKSIKCYFLSVFMLLACPQVSFALDASKDASMDPDKLAKLEQFTMDIIGKLTPEEQEEVFRQAMDMEKQIAALPEEERKKIEQDLEKELNSVMESGALEDLTKALEERPEQQEARPMPEPEIKDEIKEVKKEKVKDLPGVEELQDMLKDLSNSIDKLFVKTEKAAKVSTSTDVEEAWKTTKPNLTELQSYVTVASNNKKVANALLSDEFVILKDQIKNFYNKFKREASKLKMDEEAIVHKLNFDSIVNMIHSEIEDHQLLWNTKRLIQKHAPEEVKSEKKPEPKKIDISGAAKGSTIPQYVSPRYGKTAGQPSYRPYAPGAAGAGVGSIPGIASVPKADGVKAGLPTPPQLGKADKVKAGITGGKGQVPTTSAQGQAPAGQSRQPAKDGVKTIPFNPALHTLEASKKELGERLLKVNKEIKETKVNSLLEDYKKALSSGNIANIKSIAPDLSSALAKIDALVQIPLREAKKIAEAYKKLAADKAVDEAKKVWAVYDLKKKAYQAFYKALPVLVDPSFEQQVYPKIQGDQDALARANGIRGQILNLLKIEKEARKAVKFKVKKAKAS